MEFKTDDRCPLCNATVGKGWGPGEYLTCPNCRGNLVEGTFIYHIYMSGRGPIRVRLSERLDLKKTDVNVLKMGGLYGLVYGENFMIIPEEMAA